MRKIYIYSAGEFDALSEEFKKNKAIIRVHNTSNTGWFDDQDKCKNFYFEDIEYHQLNNLTKLKLLLKLNAVQTLDSKKTKALLKFIYYHYDHDFIIHCEFGRSRSVAIGKFISDRYGHIIQNKDRDELEHYNSLVLFQLKQHSKLKKSKIQ